jgi:type I restriction enzyme S subunit
MIEALKPYSEYKESGVPWLGQVPKHWEQHSLWTVSKLRTERNPGNLPLLSVFLDRGVIPYGEGGGQVHAPSLDLSNYQTVHLGDFVLNNQQAWRGSVGVSRYHGIISPAYIVLRLSDRIDPIYANHLMRCPRMVDQFVAASKGVGDIQRQIFWPFLRTVQVAIPSSDEQSAIVRFLDDANRRIERAIRAKKKLIALLHEQKQAIVHHAVIRGLDPNALLKSSGIPWLGDIPQHWEIIPTRHIFRQVTRKDFKGDEPKMSMSRHFGLVRSETLGNRAANAASSVAFSVCYPGDLVMNKYQAFNGLFGCAIERGLITANYSVFAPSPKAHSNYYSRLYASQVYRTAFRFQCQGVGDGMMPLYTSEFNRVPSIVPPIDEQTAIVHFVTDATKTASEAIAHAEREIELLREYRTRLVADVVTGKLDVRAAARDLPDPTDEPAPSVPEESEELFEEEQLA